MKIVDANIILRYLLRDNEQAKTAAEIMENEEIVARIEKMFGAVMMR